MSPLFSGEGYEYELSWYCNHLAFLLEQQKSELGSDEEYGPIPTLALHFMSGNNSQFCLDAFLGYIVTVNDFG